MPRAIFHRDFGLSSRRRNVGWHAVAAADPQLFPSEFIDAAVEAGVATRAPHPRRRSAPAPTQPGDTPITPD